jgi:hypothetical protein
MLSGGARLCKYHSITVVHDGKGLLARDTNRKGLSSIPELARIGKLRNSVLVCLIPFEAIL